MAGSRATALTDEASSRGCRLQSPPTGARAAAMGGAGLALIDDPGAIALNPARLAAIGQRSALIDLSAGAPGDESSTSGLLRPDPTINPYAGTEIGYSSSGDEPLSLGLLAYAHPFPLKRPLVIGVARQTIVDRSVSASLRLRSTPLAAPVTPNGGDDVLVTSDDERDLAITRYEIGAGWRITPHFSIGGMVGVGRMDLESDGVGRLADPLQFTLPGMFDPRFSGTAPEPLVRTEASGSDTALSYSFGSWWRVAPGFSLATTFRHGPRFEVGGARRDLLAGTSRSFDDVVKVPDTAALGLSWNPYVRSDSRRLRSVTIALDLERVKYSDQLEGFVRRSSILTDARFVDHVRYDADDATEIRLGAEYEETFVTWTLALRGGAYTAHDGRVHVTSASGDIGGVDGLAEAIEESAAFARDETEVHLTLGAGAKFYRFTLDGAIDVAGSATRAIVSTTLQFGRSR